MSVRAMRRAALVVAVTLVGLGIGAYLLYRHTMGFPERAAELPGRPVTLVIPRGATLPDVVRALVEKRLVSNGVVFRVYTSYRGLAASLRAGTYRLNTAITPRELLDTLVAGVPAPTVQITIPEGKNMLEVARILADGAIAPHGALVSAMRDVHFLRRLGVPGSTMEGFLFPDTYELRAHSVATDVLTALFQRHKRVYYRLQRQYAKRTHWFRRKLGWGHPEIVTLASIVEKETGRSEERPLIAGVFLNRLLFASFQPKLLQTDPTIVYGCTVPLTQSAACKRFEGRIRRIHLRDRENRYNTYTHVGLPPGPIANPGRQAIEAVFHPKRSRYLFFVSKNDGTHQFSATRAQHERAVDRYQRRRRRAGASGGS